MVLAATVVALEVLAITSFGVLLAAKASAGGVGTMALSLALEVGTDIVLSPEEAPTTSFFLWIVVGDVAGSFVGTS